MHNFKPKSSTPARQLDMHSNNANIRRSVSSTSNNQPRVSSTFLRSDPFRQNDYQTNNTTFRPPSPSSHSFNTTAVENLIHKNNSNFVQLDKDNRNRLRNEFSYSM